MTEKTPKTLIKSQSIPRTVNKENAIVHGWEVSTSHLLPWDWKSLIVVWKSMSQSLGVKRRPHVVLCKASPYLLNDILGPFSVILQRWNFIKLNDRFLQYWWESENDHKITSIFYVLWGLFLWVIRLKWAFSSFLRKNIIL